MTPRTRQTTAAQSNAGNEDPPQGSHGRVREAVGGGAEAFELATSHGVCETLPSLSVSISYNLVFRADEDHSPSVADRNVVQPLSTAGIVASLPTLSLSITSPEAILH